MQTAGIGPEPFARRSSARDGIGDINLEENSTSSNGSSYNCEGSRAQEGLVRLHGVVRTLVDKPTDLQEASKSTEGADFRRGRAQLLESNQESEGTKNVPDNSNHICRYCNRQFTSGRALGGHMRAHGSLSVVDPEVAGLTLESDDVMEREQLSGSNGNPLQSVADPKAECDSGYAAHLKKRDQSPVMSSAWARFKEFNWSRSGFPTKSGARGLEDVSREEDDAWSVRGSSSSEANNETGACLDDEFDDEKAPSSHDKVHPLYALRRNPKRSRRFTDREFALDAAGGVPIPDVKKASSVSPERARACSECGKEFPSWKALFGHMRCHPEREWRGIQPPDSLLQQERGGSSSGGAPTRRKRTPPYRAFAQDSGIELESDLENKQGGEGEASNKKEEEEEEVEGEERASIKKEHGQAANWKGRQGEASSKQEEGEECDTVLQQNAAAVVGSASNKGGKNPEHESDADSTQGGYEKSASHLQLLGWVTGKRSKRSRHSVRPLHLFSTHELELASVTTPTEVKEERDMADCLVMLACAGRSLGDLARSSRQLTDESALSDPVHEKEEAEQEAEANSVDSEADEMDWGSKAGMELEMDMEVDEASLCEDNPQLIAPPPKRGVGIGGMKYECSTCKRSFNSHQALGGHRASHRKVKGCFARTNAGEETHESAEEDITEEELLRSEEQLQKELQMHHQQQQLIVPLKLLREENRGSRDESQETRKFFKGHECSICHRVFASGQALGGHKRCHWTGERTTETASVASSNKQASTQHSQGGQIKARKEDLLDLNLPAPLDEEDMEVAYDMAEVVPAYSGLLDPKKGHPTLHSVGLGKRHDIGLLSDSENGNINDRLSYLCGRDSFAAHRDSWERRLEKHEGLRRRKQELAMSGQVDLNLSRFVHCNVCDSFFTSLEALSNHQKTHGSFISSVAGLTPISA